MGVNGMSNPTTDLGVLPATLVSRLRGWVAGFDRNERPSTAVARELMVEAIEILDEHHMYALHERLVSRLATIRSGLEALKEIAHDRRL